MKKLYYLFLFIPFFTSCHSVNLSNNNQNPLEKVDKSNWISLFDGATLSGWHGFNKKGKIENWKVENSTLTCLGRTGGADFGGDIVTDNEFGDFELIWDWKIAEKANSGLMYHVIEDVKYKAPYETGPEYQLIDDIGFGNQLEDWQKVGANYAMNPADQKQLLIKKAGEWNTSRIIYNKGHVQHWLNGKKIVEFEERTSEWNLEKTQGKWKDYPDYKISNKGKIALQDHGDRIWIKNIKIREL